MRTLVLASMMAALAAAPHATAQETAPAKSVSVYRIEAAVHESEGGKRVQSRQYSVVLEEGGRASHRAGTRVPVPSGDGKFNYIDVGANLDFRVRERGSELLLDASLDISDSEPSAYAAPLIRSIRTSAQSAVRAGQRTIVSSLDDAAGKRHYELEVTVHKVR